MFLRRHAVGGLRVQQRRHEPILLHLVQLPVVQHQLFPQGEPQLDLELIQRVAVGRHSVDVIVLGRQLSLARLVHVRQPFPVRRPRFQPLG